MALTTKGGQKIFSAFSCLHSNVCLNIEKFVCVDYLELHCLRNHYLRNHYISHHFYVKVINMFKVICGFVRAQKAMNKKVYFL